MDLATFQEWWKSGGRAGFLAFANYPGVQKSYTNNVYNCLYGSKAAIIVDAVPLLPSTLDYSGYSNKLAEQIDRDGPMGFDAILETYTSMSQSAGVSALSWIDTKFTGIDVPNQVRVMVKGLRSQMYGYWKYKQSTGVIPSDSLQPVRNWHYLDRRTILHDGIILNDQIFNTVCIGKDTIPANAMIPEHYRRVLDVNQLIVNVEQNVLNQRDVFKKAYAQTFLREEVGKMYRGEIVLLGTPEIEPFDVLVLNDPTVGISGPVEVESVIHSFSQENGYITIVRPRALVTMNDRMTISILTGLKDLWSEAWSYSDSINEKGILPVPGVNVDPAALMATSVASLYWVLGGEPTANTILISPLTRFNRPWLGGVQGWKVTDIYGYLEDRKTRFWEDEFEPLLESYKTARGIVLD
jgi:hypothetical protein